ncbi:hypothetical protein MLD38_015763 [Melastoma candidum]|uniref:Uncharacterized protein n=1 Tax=Melastoma candidum TaxID=119954 RepID=A0ACB9RK98_9MYRT|nr:hypothetical protein MLD38_015763 [Melastoma candidum]
MNFMKHCAIELSFSAYFLCLDVGKPKRPNYIPLELCSLVSLQRYTTALSPLQRPSLVGKSRQKPQERIQTLTHAFRNYCYDEDPVLVECGTTIEKQLIQFEGRVLKCPKLKWVKTATASLVMDRPWKKKCLADFGVVMQCIAPVKINDQYLTNVLLKINPKFGGINSLLAIEHASGVPIIRGTPTLILGMDVSHGSPGQSDVSSIAAVVGSHCWPLISRYGARVRSQLPKLVMIDALYMPLENGFDNGIIRELLMDFYLSSNKRKPSETVSVNHSSIKKCASWYFVDAKIVHPINYDFYMCNSSRDDSDPATCRLMRSAFHQMDHKILSTLYLTRTK